MGGDFAELPACTCFQLAGRFRGEWRRPPRAINITNNSGRCGRFPGARGGQSATLHRKGDAPGTGKVQPGDAERRSEGCWNPVPDLGRFTLREKAPWRVLCPLLLGEWRWSWRGLKPRRGLGKKAGPAHDAFERVDRCRQGCAFEEFHISGFFQKVEVFFRLLLRLLGISDDGTHATWVLTVKSSLNSF